MSYKVPEQFKDVDLAKPHTWSNATIEEWVDKRRELKSKAANLPTQGERFKTWVKVSRDARIQLRVEDKENGRRTAGPLSGLQRHRLEEIMLEKWPDGDDPKEGFTKWELEFLRKTEWIDKILDREPFEDLIHVSYNILMWLHDVEQATGVRQLREENRARIKDSVAAVADPGRRLPRNQNPYLPHPLELILIYRRTLVVLDDLRRSMKLARSLDVVLDEFGAAYPCPNCGARYLYIHEAKECCEAELKAEHIQQIEQYAGCVPPGQVNLHNEIRDLMQALHSVGYDTAVDIDQVIAWGGWGDFEATPPFDFAKRFLGHLFSVEKSTIRKKLNRRDLAKLYREYKVHRSLRHYLDQKIPLLPSIVFGKNWFESLDEDGRPTFDAGHHLLAQTASMAFSPRR